MGKRTRHQASEAARRSRDPRVIGLSSGLRIAVDADAPSTRPVQPEHGGALAPAKLDKEKASQPDPSAPARRQRLYAAVTRFVAIPGTTELDIEVDTHRERVPRPHLELHPGGTTQDISTSSQLAAPMPRASPTP